VLHNMLLAVQDSYVISGTDPLRPEARHRDDKGGLAVSEQPFSHSLGVAKRNDLADIFVS
jgi:hypothetical protein